MAKELGKIARNFGRRGTPAMGSQKIGPGDCLSKTQGYAKSEDDVYGLTPARCRKVKRGCYRKRSIELKPR